MTDSITIFCKNNRVSLEVPSGSTLTTIYDLLGAPLQHRPMNAQVNNKTESLTYACWQPKEIEYIDYTRDSGQRTYVRSLCHLFSKAVHDLLPDASLHLEHPVSKGYYCTIEHAQPIRPALIEQIKQRMQDLIDADLPFQLHRVRTPEAIALFQKNGMPDKVKLIESAGMLYTSYYELDGYINYFYGCLTPSTGYLHLFDLQPYADGILLRVPQRNNPAELAPMIRQDKMFHAYSEHLVLQHALNLNNVGDLNEAIKHGHANEVIQVSEAMQEKQVAKIAEEIARRYQEEGTRIVLISGPSSSGKTTFCKRLQVQLATNLLHPIGISLDDYFLNREDTPKDEEGEYDFESLYALDLPYFNNDLKRLLAGEEIDLPTFHFETGKRIYRGEKLKMQDHSILVIEGIHGLNPELTSFIEEHYKYVSDLKQYLCSRLSELEDITINSKPEASPYIVNISVSGIRSEIMLHWLESREIYVSSGSACSKGAKSGVLEEFGLSQKLSDSALRISLDFSNTESEIDEFIKALGDGQQKILKSK